MRLAQASAVGQKYIPADEPNFLKGWTLCVVETDGEEPRDRVTKVIVPFLLGSDKLENVLHKHSRVQWQARMRALRSTGQSSTARREKLWSEPNPAGRIRRALVQQRSRCPRGS